jgi:predicted RNA binding protein YcfA (HicA-like mRNA interferase family)
MSKWDKLIEKLYKNNSSFRFDEISKILYNYGYTTKETKGGSSHITFRKEGKKPITIPRHGKIKKTYISLVKKAVEEEEDE